MQIVRRCSVRLGFLIVAALFLSMATGCCTRTARNTSLKKPDKKASIKEHGERNDKTSEKKIEHPSREDELNTGDPLMNESRRRKAEQYRRLEYAYRMLSKSDPQGALRELERLQMDIREDPYLEMQTWYLSAMVYHKLGKPSRRKRSMRKTLEVMEQMQKDPRFKAAFADGKISQEVIDMAIKKAGDKYAD